MTPIAEVGRIASQFAIEEPYEIAEFHARGNINLDTYLVSETLGSRRYLLQRVNSDVFSQPDRVMAGMAASLEAQKIRLKSGAHSNTSWRAIELIPTRDGLPFIGGENHATWRLMSFIEDTVTYKSLNDVPETNRMKVASEVGRGLAIYSDLTASINPAQILPSLPGYRDTRIYFRQFHSSLAGNTCVEDVAHLLPDCPDARAASERHFLCALPSGIGHERREDPELAPFIELALKHESLAMTLQEARESGHIRTTVIHGDTKIENFLFDKETGAVVSLVDLDTVMPLTWLADWGDMARSLSNPAGEKECDLDKVVVSNDAYAAVLEGFLGTASTPTKAEIELMPRAVQAITLELGVRFLADYLRGDTYFGLREGDPADLNKRRAMVQISLFEKLLKHESEASRLIKQR